MGKLYVYAIGGSGSRVLRSLTMLLANGIVCKDEIVPMIIDPDYSNGDLIRTTDLMRLYGEIHKSLQFSSNTANKFFSLSYFVEVDKNTTFSISFFIACKGELSGIGIRLFSLVVSSTMHVLPSLQ